MFSLIKLLNEVSCFRQSHGMQRKHGAYEKSQNHIHRTGSHTVHPSHSVLFFLAEFQTHSTER